MKNKVYLKEGLKLYDDEGNLYEIEDGDYVIMGEEIYDGPVLNMDLISRIEDSDKREEIMNHIATYGEHLIIDQLLKGIEVEKEHTDDEYVALQISADHIAEFYDYYDRLRDMEAEAKKEIGE